MACSYCVGDSIAIRSCEAAPDIKQGLESSAGGGRDLARIIDIGLAVRLSPLAVLVAVAGCGEPQPGLETPERTAALERCDVKLAALASSEAQLKRLCDCTTGRLAQQGFTLVNLDGEHRDRAMEQVRWCMTQSGAVPLKMPDGTQKTSDGTGKGAKTAPVAGSEVNAAPAAE